MSLNSVVDEAETLIRRGLAQAAEDLLLEHLENSMDQQKELRVLARLRILQGHSAEAISLLKKVKEGCSSPGNESPNLDVSASDVESPDESTDKEKAHFFTTRDFDPFGDTGGESSDWVYSTDYALSTELSPEYFDASEQTAESTDLGSSESHPEASLRKLPAADIEETLPDTEAGGWDSDDGDYSADPSSEGEVPLEILKEPQDADSRADDETKDAQGYGHELDEVPDIGQLHEIEQPEESDAEYLFPDDIDEFEDGNEHNPDDDLEVETRQVSFDSRAEQEAINFVLSCEWDRDCVPLIEEIFQTYGYSRTKRSLRTAIESGVEPQEIRLAFECRLLWSYYPEFHVVIPFSPWAGVKRIPHFKSLSWPLAITLVQSYPALPATDEIEQTLLTLYDEWRRHTESQHHYYVSFYGYLAYCLYERLSTRVTPEFSFDDGSPWVDELFDTQAAARDFVLERDLEYFGLEIEMPQTMYPAVTGNRSPDEE